MGYILQVLAYRTLFSDTDFSHLKIIDLGNAIHCIHDELSLYYDDFQLQTFLYRAPEVGVTI